MPITPHRRTDYPPLKLLKVTMSQVDRLPAAATPVISTINRGPEKIPAAVPPTDGNRPGKPHAPAGPPKPRPASDDGAKRVFISRPSSSRTADRRQDIDGPVRPLPVTRYRFGAARSDEYAANALPPVPAQARGQRDPVRTAIEVWRGIEKCRRALAAPRAKPAPAPAGAPEPGGTPAPGTTHQED